MAGVAGAPINRSTVAIAPVSPAMLPGGNRPSKAPTSCWEARSSGAKASCPAGVSASIIRRRSLDEAVRRTSPRASKRFRIRLR